MSTNVKKKSTAGNSKFSYKYTDLATIHEAMEEQGITYRQYTEFDEKAQADYIWTVLKYNDEKEEKPLRGVKIIEGNTLTGGNICQQYGSSISYCRRYSLLMALGWATEDDDAQSVQTMPSPKQKTEYYQGHADGRLDFDSLKSWLDEKHTAVEVLAAKEQLFIKYPNLSDKQVAAVNRIFATKLGYIGQGKDTTFKDAEEK